MAQILRDAPISMTMGESKWGTEAAAGAKCVLVADDNQLNRRVAAAMLERLGYRSEACSNGREAVAACLERTYCAVLMDGWMPEMDGLEASREIRRRERGRRTPIIAFTASVRSEDRSRCLEAGMDDFLVKPTTIDSLGAALERWARED